jgi:hypothetical protein
MATAVTAALILLVGVFVAGYWPQSRARANAEEQLRTLDGQLTAAQTRLRVAELLGQVLTVKEVAARRNYGQAQELSSTFFDAVRIETMSTGDSVLRNALNDVLGRRDVVIAALARSDPAVTEALHELELLLRRALNFATPPSSTP